MDRLSFEHCYLINLFNVSVEKFVSNSPSTPGESKRNQFGTNLRITNKHAAVFKKKNTCLG